MMASDFLEPERLRAFVTVAETGNFTRAAERLHLTQPAITVQVRRLEESVGKALFERNSQFARLTKDGEVMLGYAEELLEVIDRARRQFAQPPLEGSVRFGMVEDFGTTALPAILGRLRDEHPHFELTVETGLGVDLVRRLEAGSLDLILTKRVPGGNESAALCRQNLVWVGQPKVLKALTTSFRWYCILRPRRHARLSSVHCEKTIFVGLSDLKVQASPRSGPHSSLGSV